MSKIYVLYHDHCADGFCAAFYFWKRYRENAEYIPCTYGKPLPEFVPDSTIYMVDFSVDRETAMALSKEHKLFILDHHKTAQASLEGLEFATFDMNKSGATMAFEFVYGIKSFIPNLAKYVQDRDLWKWELPGSREISAVIAVIDTNFYEWLHLEHKLEHNLADVEQIGKLLLKQQKKVIENQISQSFLSNTDFGKAAFASAMTYQSETGEALLAKYPEAKFAVCFVVGFNSVRMSLRSRGDVDVSEIAEQYGGGGHKAAAGMTIPIDDLSPLLAGVPV